LTDLQFALARIFSKHPKARNLTPSRLSVLLYLVDWRSSIQHGRRLDGLTWQFDENGSVMRLSVSLPDELEDLATCAMNEPIGMRLVRKHRTVSFEHPPWLAEVVDFVVARTAKMSWLELLKLTSSTFPRFSEPPSTDLDLVKIAREYQKYRPLLTAV
jgi:hypothetical protein